MMRRISRETYREWSSEILGKGSFKWTSRGLV